MSAERSSRPRRVLAASLCPAISLTRRRVWMEECAPASRTVGSMALGMATLAAAALRSAVAAASSARVVARPSSVALQVRVGVVLR